MQIVKLLGDKVLIRRDEAAKVTSGGIIMPEVAQEQNRKPTGVIVHIGNGDKAVSSGLKAGDRVWFAQGFANEIDLGGEKLYDVDLGGIVAVVEG
jgi:co-chaperonin GroES (HSP10)